MLAYTDIMEGSLDGIFTGVIIGVVIVCCCCCYRIAQKRIPTATDEICTSLDVRGKSNDEPPSYADLYPEY